ncbi:DUF4214 domain-containing protein [Massilia agri]|uniref:DUF4214 domain-containing protein n=1 Tax=Massilia agri TaxID=1886785 RepID=A0ABT2AJ95_9BURK|nr:DUF4214 domain-containing protein [Massilia agri]MCS0596301.1 DUF4214 domain-containing protein [Massilia agri]
MANVSDINTTPLSGLNHIDALLDKGPDWNFLTSNTANTIYYTFSVSSGIESTRTGQEAFTLSQQSAARYAFNYLQQLTGIKFVETSSGTSAQLHLANIDISGSTTTGLCSWSSTYYQGAGGNLVSYGANAYIYLDNNEWYGYNRDLSPGGVGYQTLLHELGHALGLSHPFHEADEEQHIHLSTAQDNTANTIMSYTDKGGPYSTFSPYDIAALNWLYGGDGLGGALGINSESGARYTTGTSAADTLNGTAHNDTLQGNGGNDMINGGNGIDTAVFTGVRSNYTLTNNVDGSLQVASGLEGIDTLTGVELLQFADVRVERASVGSDTIAPAAPVFAVTKNANGFTTGNTPLITGMAEANATVSIYNGQNLIATVKADARGVWSAAPTLPDAMNYRVHATATDAAGNVSARSTSDVFHVDGTAPHVPTNTFSLAPGSNKPVFSGIGEAGTEILLVRIGENIPISATSVGPDGKWTIASTPLPDGSYVAAAASVDKAGNATSASTRMEFVIASTDNQTGGDGNDTFIVGAGDNAIDGGAGRDTVVYAGSMADYTIKRSVWGFNVTTKSPSEGTDALINVERIQFSDGYKALDVDGLTGQIFRLYEAALGRPAEPTGLGYWMQRMEKGASLVEIAHEFTWAPEFKEKYGSNPNDADFLRQLYLNILDREPDPDGYAYWVGRIDDSSREQIMVEFSESVENKAQVIGTIQNGMEYIPYVNP